MARVTEIQYLTGQILPGPTEPQQLANRLFPQGLPPNLKATLVNLLEQQGPCMVTIRIVSSRDYNDPRLAYYCDK